MGKPFKNISTLFSNPGKAINDQANTIVKDVIPTDLPKPEPLPTPPTEADAQSQVDKENRAIAQRKGKASTILSQGYGFEDTPASAKKILLGA